MAAVQKGLGIVFLLVGIVLLVGGAAAAVFGAMDAQAQQEDQGPLGIGADEERMQTARALLVGGLTAAGLGAALSLVGIILLVVRSKQVALETVRPTLDEGGHEELPQAAAPHDKSRAGLLIGTAGVLLLFSLGFALAGIPSGALDDGTGTSGRLEQRTYDGRLSLAGSMAGEAPNRHIETFTATPEGTGIVRVVVDWEPAGEQAGQLQVTLQMDRAGTWTDMAAKALAPGGMLEAQDASLDRARIRVIVQPVDGAFVVEQAFTVQVSFLR